MGPKDGGSTHERACCLTGGRIDSSEAHEFLAHSIIKFSVFWETEQLFLPVIFPFSLSLLFLLFLISSFLLIFLFLCPTEVLWPDFTCILITSQY